MIRSHVHIRFGPSGAQVSALLLALSSTVGNPAVAAGDEAAPSVQNVEGTRSHEELYREYNRSALELKPLYQIESWLGYMRLHPDTPYRDNVRWKLRYLAAALTEQESTLLLAMLALEGLPDQLNALTDIKLQQQAVAEYLLIHPGITQSPPHLARLQDMLRRIKVEDPARFVAEKTNRVPLYVASEVKPVVEPVIPAVQVGGATADTRTESSSTPLTTGAGSVSQPVGSTETAGGTVVARLPDPPGQPSDLAQVTPPASGTSLATGLGGAVTGSSSASETKRPPDVETATLASIPKVEPRAPEPGPTGMVRLYRWKAGMVGMSAEAKRQMWSTYLLLYPDGSEAPEALQELRTAQQAVEADQKDKMLREEALEAELAKSLAYQDEVVRLKEKVAFRSTLILIGTILLGLVLVTPL